MDSAADDHRDHVTAPRSKGHPYSYLSCSLSNFAEEDSIGADDDYQTLRIQSYLFLQERRTCQGVTVGVN